MGVAWGYAARLLPVIYALAVAVIITLNSNWAAGAGDLIPYIVFVLLPALLGWVMASKWLRDLPLFMAICEAIAFVPALWAYGDVALGNGGSTAALGFVVLPAYQLAFLALMLLVGWVIRRIRAR